LAWSWREEGLEESRGVFGAGPSGEEFSFRFLSVEMRAANVGHATLLFSHTQERALLIASHSSLYLALGWLEMKSRIKFSLLGRRFVAGCHSLGKKMKKKFR